MDNYPQVDASANHGVHSEKAPLSALPQGIEEQIAAILEEVRAIRQSQDAQSKKLYALLDVVDRIDRDLSEHIYGGPRYTEDPNKH